MTDDLREPEDPAAYGLAKLIASYPVSTVQAAFRYLNTPLSMELSEDPYPARSEFIVESRGAHFWNSLSHSRETLQAARFFRETMRPKLSDARLRIVRWDHTSTVVEQDPEPAAGKGEKSDGE